MNSMPTMETFHGHIRTQLDAILLFEACRLGVAPRIRRRLSERERLQIKSGSVYVWDEREAGMRRWTDGKSWSASRVSGSFLTYREMDHNRKGHPDEKASGRKRKNTSPHAKRSSPGASPSSEEDENDECRYKKDGLYKQSFSLTTSTGLKLHMISYYTKADLPNLQQPSSDERLKGINIPLEMYPDSSSSGSSLVPAITTTPLYSSVAPFVPPASASSPSLSSTRYQHPPSPPHHHNMPYHAPHYPQPYPQGYRYAPPPSRDYYARPHPQDPYYRYPPPPAHLAPPQGSSSENPGASKASSNTSPTLPPIRLPAIQSLDIPSPGSTRNSSPSDALSLRSLCDAAVPADNAGPAPTMASALNLARMCHNSLGPAESKSNESKLPSPPTSLDMKSA